MSAHLLPAIVLTALLFSAPLARARAQPRTPQLSVQALAAPSLPSAHSSSLRLQILRSLAQPDIAVILLGAGVLLIFAECNLPGSIVPGALGLLLLLSSIYGLSRLPLRPAALLSILFAIVCLLVSARAPLFALPAGAGTASLVYGLSTLIARSGAAMPIHPTVGVSVGLILGLSASLLGRIASRARSNKAVLSSGSA